MRALEFRHFGDPSRLQLVDRPDPHAAGDTAVVRVEAASINPSDVKNVAGAMPQTSLPRIPGRDYSGVVIEGPIDWIGAAVWGTGGDTGFTRDGTHAELVAVPVASLARKPERLSHEQAASVGVTFLTAWIGVVEYARLADGETLAVIGVGGVGAAAMQLARWRGAHAVGITRGAPTEGVQADVVLNTAGGEMFAAALAMAKRGGRVVVISPGKERRVTFDIQDFYRRELRLFGVDSLQRDLTAAARILRELAPGFDSGALMAPEIGAVMPLAQAREAYELVGRGHLGRIVLRP